MKVEEAERNLRAIARSNWLISPSRTGQSVHEPHG